MLELKVRQGIDASALLPLGDARSKMNRPRISVTFGVCYNEIMPKVSAGLLLYRKKGNVLEVFLVHPGGPFFATKDSGAWSIPKGELDEGENALTAAQREFEEETGFKAEGEFFQLAPVTQKGGKIVEAWALEGDCDSAKVKSNTFMLEWPPRSGRQQEFPEVDRAGWFGVRQAKQKINPAQISFLEELEREKG